VTLPRFRKPKAACFLSSVGCRPKANISNFMKNRSFDNGRSHMREGELKKEVKKVNMVDVLSIQEHPF
jgi:hypothetical protein